MEVTLFHSVEIKNGQLSFAQLSIRPFWTAEKALSLLKSAEQRENRFSLTTPSFSRKII